MATLTSDRRCQSRVVFRHQRPRLVMWRGHVTRSDSEMPYLRLHTWAAEDNGGVDRWRSCQRHRHVTARAWQPRSANNYTWLHLGLYSKLLSLAYVTIYCHISELFSHLRLISNSLTIWTRRYTYCRHSTWNKVLVYILRIRFVWSD